MTVLDGRLIERLATLEGELVELRNRVEGYGRSDDTIGTKRHVRIGKTKAGGSSYPANGDDNTFPFAFQDALYTESQGNQSVTITDRQLDGSDHLIRHLHGAHLFEDDQFVAFRHNERWWTPDAELTFDAVVTASSGIDSNGSGTVEIYREGMPTGVEVTAWNDWPDDAPALDQNEKIRVRYWINEKKYRVIVTSAAKTLIRLGFVNHPTSNSLDHNEFGNVDLVDQNPNAGCGAFETTGQSIVACNSLRQRLWNGALVALAKVPISEDTTQTLDVDGLSVAEMDAATVADVDLMDIYSEELFDVDTMTIAELDGLTMTAMDTAEVVAQPSDIWHIIQEWSAKMIRGKLADDLREDDIFQDLNYLVPLDGHYTIAAPSQILSFWNMFGQQGSQGDDAIVVWDDQTNLWILLPLGAGGGGARLYYGTANEDIDYGEKGNVTITDFDPAEVHEVENTVSTRVWAGSPVAVARTELISISGPTILQDYRIVKAYTATEIRGKLKTALQPGDASGTLKGVVAMNGHYAPGDPDNISVDNWRDEFGCVDYEAFAGWDDTTKTWQLRAVKRPTFIWGTAIAGVSYCGGVEPTYSVSGLTGFGYGCLPSASSFTISNPSAYRFEIGDSLDLVLDIEALTARIIAVRHKATTLVTAVEYDTGLHRFIERRTQVVVPKCDNSDINPIVTLTRVDAVQDLVWNEDEKQIEGQRKQFYVFEVSSQSTAEVDFYNCDGSQG